MQHFVASVIIARILSLQLFVIYWKTYGQTCLFPEYLYSETNDVWNIIAQDEKKEVTFLDEVMHVKAFSSYDREIYRHICYEKLDGGKYLVSLEDRNGESFLCLQFHKRSENVIQISTSNSSSYKRVYLCDDDRLVLNDKPMFKAATKNTVECPLVGGFDMTVYEPDGRVKCAHRPRYGPLRLESECGKGEGMTFKFRFADCIDSSSFIDYKELKVSCIASWQHTNVKAVRAYQFVALVVNINTKLLCMRIEKETSNIYKAYLFFDFVCDTRHEVASGKNYVVLELTRRIYSNPCMDQYDHCEDMIEKTVSPRCEWDEILQCPKTCRKCNPHTPISTCKFADTVRGNWILHGAAQKRYITITRSTVNIENQNNYTCLKIPAQEFPKREVLIQRFDNGCHPRYYCVDTELPARSTSVLLFRLSYPTSWPLYHKERLKQHVCSNSNFGGDTVRRKAKPTLVLIKQHTYRSEKCRLPGYKGNVLGFRDSRMCGGCWFRNRRRKTREMQMYFQHCSQGSKDLSRVQQCVWHGNLTMPTLITKLKVKPKTTHNEYMCWVFPEKGRIIALAPADCHGNIPRKVENKDVKPFYDWIINEKPNNCPKPHKKSTTTSVPSSTVHKNEYSVLDDTTTLHVKNGKIMEHKLTTISNNTTRNYCLYSHLNVLLSIIIFFIHNNVL